MFAKILYPTDFSDVSKKALAYIKSLKGTGSKQVIILHVVNDKRIEYMTQGVAWAGKDVGTFLEEVHRDLEAEAYKKAESVESELKDAGFEVKVLIERGTPYAKILEAEEEEGASVIVLGSHGKSNLREMLLGSVSENIIRHSQTPVLVVKRD
jgi:nucleotide-binding universal stress UspA family protein